MPDFFVIFRIQVIVKMILHPDGTVDKQPVCFESYDLAFTYATLDLKRFWKEYREKHEKEFDND